MIYTSEKLKREGKQLNEKLAKALDENEILEHKVKDDILPNEELIRGRIESFLSNHVKNIPIFYLEKDKETDEFDSVFYMPIRDRLKKEQNEINKELCGKLNFSLTKLGFLTCQISSMPIKSGFGTETIMYDPENIPIESIDDQYSNLPELLAKFIEKMTELESSTNK